MGTGQVHKEVYEKKVEEEINLIIQLEKQGLWDYIDTFMIKQVLRDSIKFYYE